MKLSGVKRIQRYFATAFSLARGGITYRSAFLLPIRRRLLLRQQISLRNGISIVAPIGEPLLKIYREVWLDRCYAQENLRISPGETIVDVGANVGLFTLWAAANYPQAKIISLEPSPRICSVLQDNVSRNGLDNVRIVQGACGGQRREAILYARGSEAMNTLYLQDNYGSDFQPLARTAVFTLGDVFERFNVSVCGLLKLDCEGAEYEILYGAEDGILDRVQRLSMEYHVGLNQHRPDSLVRFLTAHGFEANLLAMRDEEEGYLYAKRR